MSSESLTTFGEKLRSLRKAKKLTQKDLALLLGVSQVTIANYERGERFPKKKSLLMLANHFQVSIDTLVSAESYESHPLSIEEYSIATLLNILLNDTTEAAFSYTCGWQNKEKWSLADVYDTIFVNLLKKTGELWELGELLVSEEHLISAKIRDLIITHANRQWKLEPVVLTTEKKWMGLCAPGEKHELALLMYSQLLRVKGWTVYYLGTQVPYADLLKAIKKYNPDVLAISVTLSEHYSALEMLVDQLKKEFPSQLTLLLGGEGDPKYHSQYFKDIIQKTEAIII